MVLAVAAASLNPVPAGAGQSLSVATDYWPPFRIRGPEGLGGIDVDLMNVLSKRLGIEMKFEIMPWARCLVNMEGGSVDLMTGLARTPEREVYVRYAKEPYYMCAPAFYRLADAKDGEVGTYGDLRGLRIGFTRGSAYFDPFDSDEGLSKVMVAQEQMLIDMLLEEHIDVFVGTDCQVDYHLRQLGLLSRIVKTKYHPDERIKLYLGVSRRSPNVALFDALERELRRMVDDGTVDRIVSGYVGAGASREAAAN
ncbi:substrate-binding periplasmic protein [Paucidesulfovibrio longus]|uniref:substrate-binding periplasmic protein n=1 Tax=Paucidesulfovibrio longus TaxID=889 RepID=UPI0003B55624|nr:transporter substrate-binding domain-containing protein [Paucidesulfovibrio longus]